MKLPLDELACQTNTDRSSTGWHDYMRTYEEYLEPFRGADIRLLEMGILGGDGLLTWSRYFTSPGAVIVGIDIETDRCQKIEDRRVKVLNGSQCDPKFIESLPHPFDVIIDDASHFATQQIASFFILWPRLAPGGLYFIEDLHTYASPQHCDGPTDIMQFLTGICREMQAKGPDGKARREPGDLWPDVATITFRKGLCILRKN